MSITNYTLDVSINFNIFFIIEFQFIIEMNHLEPYFLFGIFVEFFTITKKSYKYRNKRGNSFGQTNLGFFFF